MSNEIIVKFHIRRYDPLKDKEPYLRTYEVPVQKGMVVLDALHISGRILILPLLGDTLVEWGYAVLAVC